MGNKDPKRYVMLAVMAGVFLLSLFLVRGVLKTDGTQSETSVFARGVVTELLVDDTEADDDTEGILRGRQEVIVEITSGAYKGGQYMTTNYLSAMYNINARPGTRVIVRLDGKEDGGVSAFLYSYDRSPVLGGALAFFAGLLIITGRGKGFRAIIALAFTLAGVWGILFPLIEYGYPVIICTILLICFTTLFTFVLIDGINKKTVSATLGTLAGVTAAGIFAMAAGHLAHIGGFQTNEAEELMLIGRDHGMRISNLFTAGILIASSGAVMDVAMSISSALNEMYGHDPDLTAKELARSGINIGRDVMGTMANTLILAFAGSSFTLLLLIYYYNVSFLQLINTDLVARELIQGIAGSVGIVLTVPFVAMIAANGLTSKNRRKTV